MSDFAEVWKSVVRFRRVSRELEWLLRDVHAAYTDEPALRDALEALLVFLASSAGRTDANCAVTDQFLNVTEDEWLAVSEPIRAIMEDMSGTLHDAVHAPHIAQTFQATPEQLLERVRSLR
jgi:hypothetical protein